MSSVASVAPPYKLHIPSSGVQERKALNSARSKNLFSERMKGCTHASRYNKPREVLNETRLRRDLGSGNSDSVRAIELRVYKVQRSRLML